MTAAPPDDRRPTDHPDRDPGAPARWATIWRWAKPTLQICLPLIVIWIAWREFHALDFPAIRSGLAHADATLLILGIVAAFLAITAMGLYDAVAFPRGAHGTLGFRGRWLLGSVFFGWTNFISLGPLGGPAMRMLAYRHFGLTGPEITRGFVGHYIGSGSGLAAWLITAWIPAPPFLTGAPEVILRIALALGLAMTLSALGGRIAIRFLRNHHYGSELDGVPLARIGAVSFLEWTLTLCSFMLLTRSVGVHMLTDAAARTVFTGQFAGVASMIPGGLGSADAVWFKGFDLLGVPADVAAAAVVVFRAGFYLAPWITSLAILYIVVAKHSKRLRLWQRRIVAGAVMLGAVFLLLSAATPALRHRLEAVERIVPLGAIEVSHIVATLSAALMLFLVRGLLRGYRGAYLSTMALLAASVIANPLKGGDIEEAIASAVLMILLFGIRGAFTRRGRIPVGWELALAACVASVAFFLVTGFAAFDHIPYRHELWTTFAEKAEASRFLRAGLLLVLAGLIVIIRQATRPAHLWITPTPEDIAAAEAFAKLHADSADALLVGGADKGIWFWEPKPGSRQGLAILQRKGDKLIILKDPIVAAGADPARMIEALLLHAESLDVDLVFAMISSKWMEHLHDFGFHFLKVNEEAIVPLTDFSLDGGRNAGFRRTLRDMEKLGITFDLRDPPLDAALIDHLRTVSDAWLTAKGGHETQFSACHFSPDYLNRNPIGLATDAAGTPIAFVNILFTRPTGPATIDLMRYTPGSAEGVMDFVLIRSMQSMAERGASSFSLGGAPLSDVGTRKRSRLAERALHLFSLKAERIYNYRGLLHYKTKFHPQWHPRYLAYQQPWDWAAALVASARLVQARTREDRHRIAAARLGSSASPP